jgi:hypothetical protein
MRRARDTANHDELDVALAKRPQQAAEISGDPRWRQSAPP